MNAERARARIISNQDPNHQQRNCSSENRRDMYVLGAFLNQSFVMIHKLHNVSTDYTGYIRVWVDAYNGTLDCGVISLRTNQAMAPQLTILLARLFDLEV